jgi:hypothetical protein
MLIRMTTSISGAGFDLHPGDETERFSEAEAMRLIAADYAVPVAEQRIERAVAVEVATETRVPHGKRGRPRRN